MIVFDTSALIRFLTNDIADHAKKVKSLIDTQKIFIPDVVFPEIEYVLQGKSYNSSRKNLIKAFEFLLTHKNIKTSKEVKNALNIYKNSSLDMADCIIISSSEKRDLLTFDKRMKKIRSSLY